MSQAVIENPVINSPFAEPTLHFRFSDEGITDELVEGRRTSSYFVPIAKPKKKGATQLQFDTEWTQDRIEENKLVNDIRRRVALWRKGGYLGVTPATARLIAYWTDPNREKKLCFCQVEARETAIYITEVAKRYGDAWIEEQPTKFELVINLKTAKALGLGRRTFLAGGPSPRCSSSSPPCSVMRGAVP